MDGVYITNELGALTSFIMIVFFIGLGIGVAFMAREKKEDKREEWKL